MSAARPRQRLTPGPLQPWIDFGLCAVVTLAGLGAALSVNIDRGPPGTPPVGTSVYALGIALALLGGLPLAVRRRWPLGVLGLIETSVLLHLAVIAANPRATILGLAAAMYTVGAEEPRSRSMLAAVGVAAANAAVYLGLFVSGQTDAPQNFFVVTVLVAGAWALGDNIGTRRAYLASLEERARRLEREQQEQARSAVLDERSRIARELHDVVAHHVSAIAVQAGAAEEIAERDPRRAREVLGTIQAASRQALAEMRALVGVLRDEPGDEQLTPQPSLAQLDRLIAQVRGAGLQVAVRVEGTSRELPAALDLSAFRLVQEALTNTLRHASATRAEVVVRYGEDELEVTVTDDGSGGAAGSTASGAGRGLVGMRERVALFHGHLDVGRGAAGGFRVHATLPIAT
ncbi:MAG TPA: sensor histidine kinase [Candidatus Angelobacter sp.]|jgi:signal transduction histidine kinase|nr:sensor histidine kinase [Candidatus Angelobacter sp.]